MESTKLWATENKDLRVLLREYYRAFAFAEAYSRFFQGSANTVPEFTYAYWQERIQKATTKELYIQESGDLDARIRELPEDGIADSGQARAALEGANFNRNRNEFRKTGVLMGLDSEAFEAFALRTSRNGVWEQINDKDDRRTDQERDNLTYNTGVPYSKVSVPSETRYPEYIPMLQVYTTRFPDIEAREGRFLFMSQPAFAAYLFNRTYNGTTKTYGEASPYLLLAQNLAGDSLAIVNAQQGLPSLSPDTDVDAEVNRQLDISSEFLTRFSNLVSNPSLVTDPPRAGIFKTISRDSDIPSAAQRAGTLPLQVFYASPQTKRGLEGFISGFVTNRLPQYDEIIEPLLLSEDFDLTGDLWERAVRGERDAILKFFNVDTGDATELPDAPEYDDVFDASLDRKVGEKYRKEVEAARRNLTPRDMQCYLLENIKTLTDQRQKGAKYAPTYKNVKTVSSQQPALLTNLLRHGLHGTAIQKLLNLCPDVYGLLVPTIRLFRVDYDDNGNVRQIPIGKTKRTVDAEAELLVPNFIDSDDVKNILLGKRGRMAGSGIKSFSWSLDGTQPAEVDNNIRANLQLFFQSANDFFNGAKQAGQVGPNQMPQPNFLDLIINSPGLAKNKTNTSTKTPAQHLNRQYDGANFRIKAVVGWAKPKDSVISQIRNAPSGLADIIEKTQTTYFLQCVRHNLDFREDGTVTLDIEYVAALAGILSAPKANILAPSTESILESLTEIDANLDATEGNSDRQQARKEELLEQRDAVIAQDRLIKYKKLLRQMFAGASPKVYQLAVDINDMLRIPWEELSPEQRAARAKRKQGESESLVITSPQELNLTLLNAVGASLAQGGTVDAAAQFSQEEQKRYKDIITRRTEFKYVPFMFLGDLIDNVIEQTTVNNNGQKLNFTTFLSNTDLIDPLMALRIKGFADLDKVSLRDVGFLQKLRQSDPLAFRDQSGVVLSVNIGDIPISLDAFQVWFKNNVIKKDLDKFYLLYFIKKLCADLITGAFDSDCFGDDLRINQRFDAHPISIAGADRMGQNINAPDLGKKMEITPATRASKTHNCIVILPTDSRPSNLNGKEKEDLPKGIHHHHIGASCGLVKKLTFSREDQEYLREGKIQKEGALGPEQLRELYSVTLEMVGNNLYENGQYIYVSPTLLDADKDDLDYLGLHGYYMITSVASTITESGFNTTIQALHQGVNFKGNPEVTALEIYQGPAEASLPNTAPDWVPPAVLDSALDEVYGPVGKLSAAQPDQSGPQGNAAPSYDKALKLYSAPIERIPNLSGGDN
jgi:hypothetical protein